MEAKIQEALEQEGLKRSDLTEEELQELREEIIARENGVGVLDGVLWWVSRRKRKEQTLAMIRKMGKRS
jgi:hypothetical protein